MVLAHGITQKNDLLRLITCGSVDDGKSTLIGRLLFDTKQLFDDQLDKLTADSKRYGTQQGALDFALLVDGLSAEREQGITIDVAYRFFSTPKKKYVVIDAPGHEQYTRNMVTGASTADLAVILIDARYGIREQTKRHSYLVSLLGIKHLIVLINKMDLVAYDPVIYHTLMDEYALLSESFGFKIVYGIPISALVGDNVINSSQHMPWYQGKSFLDQLESIELCETNSTAPFRMPVQWVNRPHQDYRGYTGQVVSGELSRGQVIKVFPSGITARVKEITLFDRALETAVNGQSVTVCLEHEIDISRGDVLVAEDEPAPGVANQFQVHLIWMTSEALIPHRYYLLKCGTQCVRCSVTRIKHQVNIQTLEQMPVASLSLNAIAVCHIKVVSPIVFEPYEINKAMGSFILIDPIHYHTAAAGLISFALNRATTVHSQAVTLTQTLRATIKHQVPKILWFTGLSGAGKSTIANQLEKKLYEFHRHTYLIDGDNIRQGLCSDLGFTMVDRVENIRRVAEVAKLMIDAGLMVLVATISPFKRDRVFARSLFEQDEFIEIYVNTSLEVVQQRDVKGHYLKTKAGELLNFTGIDSLYEPPDNPEIILDTVSQSVDDCVLSILNFCKLSM